MLVKDLLEVEDVSMDVYDSYDEGCAIAYESGFKLTNEGREHFKDALALPIEMIRDDTIIVKCNNAYEARWCKRLFHSIAGFCSTSNFDRWFEPR